MKAFLFLYILLLTISAAQALGREIHSHDDEIRLGGFDEHKQQAMLEEVKRNSDISDIAKEKLLRQDQEEQALKEYRLEKQRKALSIDETSPEYKEYIRERFADYERQEQIRKKFSLEKSEKRMKEHRIIDLTEEHELAIDEKSLRADWQKRKFSEGPSGGVSGGRSNFDSAPTFAPPPAFTNNNPGYFDAPPPPPVPYEPFDDGMNYPPPPPPPMFEEEAPF